MKTSMNKQQESNNDIMSSNEQEYQKLLTGSLGIYRSALKSGESQETALELASRHMQHHVLTDMLAKKSKSHQ